MDLTNSSRKDVNNNQRPALRRRENKMRLLTTIVLAAFATAMVPAPGFSDTVTKTTTTVTTIRDDAPIYVRPVENAGGLEELTLEDFQRYGANTSPALQQFQAYQEELRQPSPNTTEVIYKMKVVDRELTLADFEGFHVTPELARARYQEYQRMNPIPIDGRNARYVFVYHAPVVNRA